MSDRMNRVSLPHFRINNRVNAMIDEPWKGSEMNEGSLLVLEACNRLWKVIPRYYQRNYTVTDEAAGSFYSIKAVFHPSALHLAIHTLFLLRSSKVRQLFIISSKSVSAEFESSRRTIWLVLMPAKHREELQYPVFHEFTLPTVRRHRGNSL